MNDTTEPNYETIDWPTRDEGVRFLKTLCERGVFAGNSDDLAARMKLVELGLTMPKEKDQWILYDTSGVEREEALYIFLRISVPSRNRNRNQARPSLVVLRFDIMKYRNNPLSPEFGVGAAACLFNRSVAVVSGLDYSKCKLVKPVPELN